MRIFAGLLFGVFLSTFAFADFSLTKEQSENLDELHKALKKEYPEEFFGFNGTKDKMRAIGIPESEALRVIQSVDLEKPKKAKKKRKDEEELVQKKMRKLAIDALKAEGAVLEQVAE